MIFLYGIVKGGGKRNLQTPGIDQGQAHAVSHKDLNILVSPREKPPTQNNVPKEILFQSLIEYQKFLENVLKEEDIIPFKFGTTLNDDEEAGKLLRDKYETLQKLLFLYHDLCEFSVTATWLSPQSIFETLLQEDKDLLELKKKAEISGGSTDKIKVGQRLQGILLLKNKQMESCISERIKKISTECAPHGKRDDFMVYHGSHLIQKSDIEKFWDCLEELNHTFQGRVQFKGIGPLPVYSFATIFVRRVPQETLEKARTLLGVGNSSTLEELQKAYSTLIKVYHPDIDPHHGAEKLAGIRSAYKLLSECYRDAKRFAVDQDYIGIEVKKAEEL